MLESPLQFTPSPRSSCPSSPDHPTTTAASMRKHFIVPPTAAGSSGSSSGGSTSGSKRSSGTYSVDCNASLWRRLSSKLTHTTATTATIPASTTIEANIEQVHNNNKSEMNTIAATTTEVVTEDVWRIAASATRMQDLVRKMLLFLFRQQLRCFLSCIIYIYVCMYICMYTHVY